MLSPTGIITNMRFYRITSLKRYKAPCLILFLFMILEICIFNMPFWQTLGAQPTVSGKDQLGSGLVRVGKDSVRVVNTKHEYREVESSDPIEYFRVNPSSAESESTQTWKMDTRKPTDGGWYLADKLEHYSPKYDNSRYFHVGNGATRLRFRYNAPKGAVFPISTLTFNPRIPFHLPKVRIGLELLLAFFIILFRPGSSLYRRRFTPHAGLSILGLSGVFAIQVVLLVALWNLFGGNATASVPMGKVHNGIWGGNQYQQLADALLKGHVNLDLPINQDLAHMSNPYDAASRFRIDTSKTPIYFDVAFKNGKYYSYFGILPVLLMYLPYRLLTGTPLPNGAAILCLTILATAVVTLLIVQMTKLFQRRVGHLSIGIVLLIDSAFTLGLPIPYLMHLQLFYQIPQLLSIILVFMALCCWIQSKLHRLNKAWLAAGSFCMALTIVSRPQFILASVVALPLFWPEIKNLFIQGLHSRHNLLSEIGVWACAVAPYAVVFAPALLYNRMRFGSLFDFGANYNLTGFDMPHYTMPWAQLVPLLFVYFFQPPNVSTNFPFFLHTTTQYSIWMSSQQSFGGYFTIIAPFAVVVFLLLVLRRQFRRTHMSGLCTWIGLVGIVICVFDTHLVSYDSRYILDFGWSIMLIFTMIMFLVDSQRTRPEHNILATTHDIADINAIESGRLSDMARVTIGIVMVGVIVAWAFALLNPLANMPTQYDEEQWWNVSSWFLFI